MSDFLYYIIPVSPSIEKKYWWPLIFEAAHRSAFSFQHFGSSKSEGIYFSKEQAEDIKVSFSDLWNIIYNDLDSVMVSLWFRDTSFFVQASLEEDTEKKVQIYLTMENSLLYQKSKEEMHQFVEAFLRYSLELYNLCHPENVELFWDDVRPFKMPLMQVLKKDEDIRLDSVLLSGQTLSWKQIPVSSDNKIFLLNPFPVWLFRQWNFFPVFSERYGSSELDSLNGVESPTEEHKKLSA